MSPWRLLANTILEAPGCGTGRGNKLNDTPSRLFLGEPISANESIGLGDGLATFRNLSAGWFNARNRILAVSDATNARVPEPPPVTPELADGVEVGEGVGDGEGLRRGLEIGEGLCRGVGLAD